MKVKVYLRVAKTRGKAGARAVATMQPCLGALLDGDGKVLPTIAFAVVLDIDPDAFHSAEAVIAELAIGAADVQVAAEVVELPSLPALPEFPEFPS
jgi:hypothetical protein